MSEFTDKLEKQAAVYRELAAESQAADQALNAARIAAADASKIANAAYAALHDLLLGKT